MTAGVKDELARLQVPRRCCRKAEVSALLRFAGGLQARGFGVGDTLALMAPNIPEYAVVFHGVAMAGGTVTTLNPTYTADEIRHQLNDSKATLMVTVSAVLPVARWRASR